MRIKHICRALAALTLGAALFTGCKSVPANRVFSRDDLPGKTIGVQKGTTGEKTAQAFEQTPEQGKPAAKTIGYVSGAEAAQALSLGEIDCVIIDIEPAKQYVTLYPELQILPDTFPVENYAIAVSKDNSEFTEKINKALSELHREGITDKILANYINDHSVSSPLGNGSASYQYTSPENVTRENGVLTMATNAEFPPYEWVKNGEFVGIDIDIFRAVCDKLGYEPEIKDMPFEDILDAVKSGDADIGMAAITVDPDRLNEVDFSDSYAMGVQVIITRRE